MKPIRPIAALMALCLSAPVWAADSTTGNLGLTKPEVGASEDTWGDKVNANADVIDAEFARTARGDANYTIAPTDRNIALTAAFTAERTFTLPAASALKTGQAIRIIDEAGAVGPVNRLLIQRAGLDTINGTTTVTIKAPRTAFEIRSNGSNAWSVSTIATRGVGTGDGADVPDRAAADIRYQGLDGTLSSLAAYNTNGLVAQTGADAFAGRTIAGTTNEISVTNGSGVSGNPTISLPSSLTFAGKTVTGGTFSSGAFNGTVGTSAPSTGSFTTTSTSGRHTQTGFFNMVRSPDVTIVSDTVTLSAGYHRIDTEGGAATDNLSTINGTSQYDIVFIKTVTQSRDVTLKNGVGNLDIGTDFVLDDSTDFCILFNHDGTRLLKLSCENNG